MADLHAFDPTPLTRDELLFFAADAVSWGSDHRNHHGYAVAGSLLDATADMYGALVDLTAAQNGGA
jgi:hypothetical protein